MKTTTKVPNLKTTKTTTMKQNRKKVTTRAKTKAPRLTDHQLFDEFTEDAYVNLLLRGVREKDLYEDVDDEFIDEDSIYNQVELVSQRQWEKMIKSNINTKLPWYRMN
jgi:hypothetical protein